MDIRLSTIYKISFALGLALALFAILCLRLYYEVVPMGAEYIPYTSYSLDRGTIKSPSGEIYTVRVNDGGAMHSGNHWTWVVGYRALTGYYVVTEGYLESGYALGNTEFHVNQWNGEIPVLPFAEGRY